MSWPARYRGTCDACDEPIEVGQEIEMVSNFAAEPAEYRHATCPSGGTDPRPTRFSGTTLDEMGY